MDCDTQVIIGGFPDTVTAKDLANYLERKLGAVERCRVKTTCTPYNAYPVFSCTEIHDHVWSGGSKCSPHAFVHFASAEVAHEAVKCAGREMLAIGSCVLKVQLSSESDVLFQRSKAIPCNRLSHVMVELGSLTSLNEFTVSWKGPSKGAFFELECSNKRCHLYFTQWTLFEFSYTRERTWMKCNYKLEFFVRDIWEVRKEDEMGSEGLTFIVQFRFPPRIYYRSEDDDVYHHTSFNLADDADPWIRTIDFTPEKSIGRCQGYRISVSPRQRSQFQKILQSFSQQQLLKTEELQRVRLPHEVSSTHQRCDLFLVPNDRNLPFKIMFVLNGVVHKGILKAASLTSKFYDLLEPSNTDTALAISALNHIKSYKTPVFDAERRLKRVIEWLQARWAKPEKIEYQSNKMEVQRFIITPTKAHCYSTEVELSNRVLREYSMMGDRFLRVSFMDDNFHPLGAAMLNVVVPSFARKPGPVARTALFDRVRRILLKGFTLCGRHYQFLAFSTSQLRDHSAWFFAPFGHVTVDSLHQWMGSFPTHNVAKYAARMGQCFSSTIATVRVPFDEVKQVDDIKRNGFIFSDGIGKITPDLALECTRVLNIDSNPPSAYQIRYAGYKGVVAVWPSEGKGCQDPKMTLRDSMKKFISTHEVIEVVNQSKFLPCFLNRQIITLLSSLQVKNRVFVEMQDLMVEKLNKVLDCSEAAYEVLSTFCPSAADHHNIALDMLSAGFHPLCEPHLRSMLQCIRACYLEELLSKARIFVKDGRWLMGCLDELAVLEYGECFVQVSSFSNDYVPGNLMRWNSETKVEVITGPIIMAKNPCLHPGDIRILQAVDHPALHHLVDCFVMPQKGNRPHSNEASGSDLDGDLYFVCWDSSLIPPSGQSWEPMHYEPAETRDFRRSVKTEDVVEFFMTHMVNDHLGKICNAHVVHADRSPQGALDPNCLLLAELAATAVDSPKTGTSVILPSYLRPTIYPDFMDKEDKPSYRSKKILGILFRRIRGTAERAVEENCQIRSPEMQFFDPDLIVEGFESYVFEAQILKQIYDARLIAIMGQFDVKVEAEVVTGHYTTHPLKHNSRRRGDLKERLKHSYDALKKEFDLHFRGGPVVGDVLEDEEDSLLEMLECKASAWYHVSYHPDYVYKTEDNSSIELSHVHLLSFPWIALETLARVKARNSRRYQSYHRLILGYGKTLGVS